MTAHRFSAEIRRVGPNRCVDVPADVSRALGGGVRVPVVATVEGRASRTTMVPRGGGGHRVFLKQPLWREAGLDTGDTVHVTLRADAEPRDPDVPRDIAAALRAAPEAQAAFDALTGAGRRAFVDWIGTAKREETRARRIATGLQRLVDNARAR